MIYTEETLEKYIQKVERISEKSRSEGNESRATYYDGLANGISGVMPTISAQAARIDEFETMLGEAICEIKRQYAQRFPECSDLEQIGEYNDFIIRARALLKGG